MTISRQAALILLILGIVLGVVACFLPWRGNELASLSGFNGSMGNPGIWVLILLGLRGALHFLSFKIAQQGKMVVSVLLVLFVLFQLKTAIRLEMAGPQIGIFLLLASTILLFIPLLSKNQ